MMTSSQRWRTCFRSCCATSLATVVVTCNSWSKHITSRTTGKQDERAKYTISSVFTSYSFLPLPSSRGDPIKHLHMLLAKSWANMGLCREWTRFEIHCWRWELSILPLSMHLFLRAQWAATKVRTIAWLLTIYLNFMYFSVWEVILLYLSFKRLGYSRTPT